jgi:hypothetical protein
MQRRLLKSGRQTKESRETRNRLIVDAHKQGGSLREIADLVGLTHPAVKKILSKSQRG